MNTTANTKASDFADAAIAATGRGPLTAAEVEANANSTVTIERKMAGDRMVETAVHPDDFPLGPACDLSGDGTCESCQ